MMNISQPEEGWAFFWTLVMAKFKDKIPNFNVLLVPRQFLWHLMCSEK